jgi:soluble lytic murein transglycosylase-like protein
MPLDPLYEDSTSTFLAGQNQVNIPDPGTPAPSTSLTSIAKAVGRGIGQGGASLFGAAADTASGLSQVYVDPDSTAGAALNPVEQAAQDKRINDGLAKAKAGTLFQSSAGTAAYNFADTLKPDPTNSTAIDQIVQGAVAGLTQIVPAAVLGGPLAGAAVGGASIGLGASEDLKRKGVDVGTRTAVGALEGTLGGVGAVLPAGGSTLARTAGLVALGGPGFTIGQGTAEKAILRNANYDKLADQINPLDPVNLAASTIVAGAFGGLHTAGAARAAKADGAAPIAPAASTDTPITAMPVDARKALPYNSPALDSYAQQAAQAAGVPPEMLLFIKNKGEKSNSNQVSPAGAKGVMQFTDSTYKQFGKGDPKDPVNSIDAAAAYSADLLKRYDGDVRAAITEYNGGVKQAEAVHAGGKPTDPQTIAYLQRYDEYAANHQISNLKFDPTPEQTDAALVSHGQSLVDDAHIGPADDVAAMSAHQDAFELASRQMDAGEPVDVTSVMPPEFARGDVLSDYARQIGEARTAEQPPQPAAIPKAQPLDTQTADPVRTPDAGTEPAAAKPAQAPQTGEVKPETAPSPAEQNVRQAAIEKPDTVVHLDANAGPQEGKISDLLKTIDDEHQATLQDASLLQVAANCFIGSGD